MQDLPPYLFVGISRAIAKEKEQGIDVISFGIGDPDIPTPSSVIERLKTASDNPVHHRYPESEGLPEFRQAVAEFYSRRFGVNLDYKTEVINLIGAKRRNCTCSIMLYRSWRYSSRSKSCLSSL